MVALSGACAVSRPMLQMEEAARYYPGPHRNGWRRSRVVALAPTSLSLVSGEVVGVVGESGSGKTTLARLLAGIIPPSEGRVLFNGVDLARMNRRCRIGFHSAVQLVFQDPLSALNPRRRVGESLQAPLVNLRHLSKAAAKEEVGHLLARVGLDPALVAVWPHQLSGGQAQRVVIARALAARPRIIILDEPVSALDVSVQAQILELLENLRREHGLAMLMISHDLAVVERLASRILVMRSGRTIEEGPTETLLRAPKTAYTRQLITATPRWEVAESVN